MKNVILRFCTIIMFTLGIHLLITAQQPFDSLQTIIRNEITAGTYNFLQTALVYDSLALQTADELKKGKGKNFIGMHHYFTGSHRKAIQHYLEALPHFESVQDTFYIALVNNNIGAAYEYRHEPENSISYYQKALSSFKLLNDSLWMANVYNNIAIQYNVADRHAQSLSYMDSARVLYQGMGDSSMIAVNTANMAESYRYLGDNEKAIESGQRYLREFKKFHASDVLANVHAMLAKAYIGKNMLNEALRHNEQSLAIRNQYDLNYQKANNYETFSEIYERQGDYRNALSSYKAFKVQQDSMFNKEKDDRITQLLTEYEVEQKDQEISLLASQNEVSVLRLEQANRQRLLIALGALMLLASAVALFFMLRLKSRTNAALSEKNALISKALKEKDILLREIHHRVKNNLQMISALLYLHGKSLDDASAQEALLESQNRVQSMAMIHQNLYQDENLLGVGVKEYLERLFEHLISSYNIEKDRIRITKHIEIDKLDVDTIVPLALIANELISNALKYAFRDGRQGEIRVSLRQNTQGIMQLEVQDNGPGLSRQPQHGSDNGFGYKLIRILCERLDASMHIEQGNGLLVRLNVPTQKAA